VLDADAPGARLLYFFLGLVIGFLLIRMSVRMIRAQVRWWPGNLTPGGTHIHHVVFGTIAMVVSAVVGLALPDSATTLRVTCAALLGFGTALVLDEFALILHLEDVYWTRAGRLSVDAVFLAIGMTGLLLMGARPLGVTRLGLLDGLTDSYAARITLILINLIFSIICVLKGKIWTGLLGLLIPFLAEIGAFRLARPSSPWARWRYPAGSRRLARATRRESRIHQPVVRVRIQCQEFISGQHDRTEDRAAL
jgi:hypothetical protein